MAEEKNGGIYPANPTKYAISPTPMLFISSDHLNILDFTFLIHQIFSQGVNGTTLPGPCDSPVVSVTIL